MAEPIKHLFIQLGEAQVKEPGPGVAVVRLGGAYFDAAPYFKAYEQIGAYTAQFAQNPYNPHPLQALNHLSSQLLPVIHRSGSNPHLRETLHPMGHALASYLHHSHKLIGMRLKTAHHMARAPKTVIPFCLNIAAGATATGIRIQNPYLGATGGNVTPGQYQYPWTITKFQTSNNESGQLMPIRIGKLYIGGHEFVGASLGGLTYTGSAAPAYLGWPAAMFAVTKTKDVMSTLEFWNLVALSGEGVGFGSIMTETGYMQIDVNNGSGSAFIDTWPAYANASLCGSPFSNSLHTQLDVMHHAFAPMALQGPLAMRMAHQYGAHLAGHFAADDNKVGAVDLGAASWVTRTSNTMQQIQRFVDADQTGYAVGELIGSPSDRGISPDVAGF